MNFAYSEEQEAFRETLRRFFQERCPPAVLRRRLDAPGQLDPALWKAMAEELGLQGVGIPEALGGQGFGLLERGIVFEEMGRALIPGPYFSSVALAADAIRSAGSPEEQRRWLPGLASGAAIGTLALLDAGDRWEAAAVALEARPEDGGYVLEGRKRLVSDGALADRVIVAARLPGTCGAEGLTLALVEGGSPGLAGRAGEPLDATRGIAELELDGVRAAPLGPPGGAAAALEQTLDRARVALALEAVGGAAQCLETAVAYAKQRIQFGRPIGSFQAIKHTLAELLLELESARGTAYWASWVASEAGDELRLAASVAKSACDEAYLRAAEDGLHVHGGIGVTWEAEPHLHLKRAKANALLLGTPSWQRERIASLVL